jgi:peptidoglycan/xylan/chitin deacetylase (PgdA/CDA1 family)
MSRLALPQNYIKSTGSKLVSDAIFTDPTKYSYLTNCTMSEDTVHYQNSLTKSLRCLADAAGNVGFEIHNQFTFDVTDVENIEIDIWSNNDSITMCDIFFSLKDSTHAMDMSFVSYATQLIKGWNKVRFLRANCGKNGFTLFSTVFNCAGFWIVPSVGTVDFSFEAPVTNVERMEPNVLLTFDDGKIDSYDTVFPILEEFGVKATFYVVKNYIGTAGFCTLAQLTEMHEAGHCIANHTSTHPAVLANMTYEQSLVEVGNNIDYLNANGFRDGAYHMCYPGGSHSDENIRAMTDLGIKTSVTINYELNYSPITYNAFRLRRAPVSWEGADTLAANIVRLNTAKRMNATIILMLHYIVETPDALAEFSIADLRALLTAINEMGIVPKRIDEWYNGLTSARGYTV